ncbi:MAG: hypothetical protein R3E39_25410 [Anaerolineae bacterium]
MRRLGSALFSAIVIVVGVLTLLGLVVGDGLGSLSGLIKGSPIPTLTNIFLQITVITVAVTIIIGILNLLIVHLRRIFRRSGQWQYSVLLILSALGVLILGVLERVGVISTTPAPTSILLEGVQVSIESALAGLVLFALVYAAFRLMRRRVSGSALLFTLVLLVLLAGALPFTSPLIRLLAAIRTWLLEVPVSAGARGILMGIALATVVIGVRVLIGQDRSYRE